jgi:hypothetical protein
VSEGKEGEGLESARTWVRFSEDYADGGFWGDPRGFGGCVDDDNDVMMMTVVDGWNS